MDVLDIINIVDININITDIAIDIADVINITDIID